MILDIGPATSLLFSEVLQNAKTIIWNGPMGAFEMEPFSRGTMAMVQAVANSKALTIVGGGDTDVAVHKGGAIFQDILHFHRRRGLFGTAGRKTVARHIGLGKYFLMRKAIRAENIV